MSRWHHLKHGLFALSFLVAVPLAAAQPRTEYTPEVGQEGKDVVWVPTPDKLVERMLDMAKVTAKDKVIDLGSGDGRTVIAAARRGATAVGVEYNPDLVRISRGNAEAAGVAGKASFHRGDLFETDLSGATVITLFLLPELNLQLRPKLLSLRPGTRVVSNSFRMGTWEPDQTASVSSEEGCTSYCQAFLWIVPATVEGRWRIDGGELEIQQVFQTFQGTFASNGRRTAVRDGQLAADRISFSVNGRRYEGTVRDGRIEGQVKSADGSKPFRAERVAAAAPK